MELPVFQHIKLYEDILTLDELYECQTYLYRPMWGRKTTKPKINAEVLMWRMDLNDVEFFTKKVFKKVLNTVERKLKLVDVYANGCTTAMSTFPHVDAHDDSTFIFLLYVNKDWNVEWGGQTVFINKYIEDDEEIGTNDTVSFLPRFNSALFFPANIVHMSEAPSRMFHGLRTTIAYRLEEM